MLGRFSSLSTSLQANISRTYAVRVTLSDKVTTGTQIIPNVETSLSSLSSDLRELLKQSSPTPAGSTQLVYSPTCEISTRKLLVNVEEETKSEAFRGIVHKSIQHLRTHNVREASISIEDFPVKEQSKEALVNHITRTAVLSGYEFDKYKKPKNELFEHIEIVGENLSQYQSTVDSALSITEGTLFARDLGNEQADIANPDYLESIAQGIVNENPNFSIRVIKGKELTDLGLHMIHAVGQAAQWEPRLILMEYKPLKDEEMSTVLLGKGITFDTGGLNLKPTNFIEEMHMDMCGSAAVLGAAKATGKLNLQQNIVFAISVAENAISDKAYKPGAILTSYSGKTVSVGNTDAEGRLVLADALSYTQELYKPKTIIDLATLTGACVVALGEYAAGLFSNDPALQKELCKAGDAVSERCWPMPIFPEHTEELECTVADTSSTGAGRYGGASTAAAFLQKFINEDTKWVHMDIAGPAMYSKARSYMPKGSTGFGVQTLIEFLKQQKE